MGGDDDHGLNIDLSCSALTVYGAVKKVNIGPNDNIVIVEADGLGLMAIQLAKAVTGARIIAMDLDDDKVKLAKENRADNTINSIREDAAKVVMVVSLAQRGVIKPIISNRFKLYQATEALEMLKNGKILGRGVINP